MDYLRVQDIIADATNFICDTQLPSGAIPWYKDGPTDPWDHIACAMAMDACGRANSAERAYRWLQNTQNPDGSWWYSYMDDISKEMIKDSNHSGYIATGVWYHFLVTRDRNFLRGMWKTVEKGISFALGMQQPSGEIYWAKDSRGNSWPSAPVAGCACIWKSLNDALRVAGTLKIKKPEWQNAANRLIYAIQEKPHLFNTLGDNRRGFAMAWYYPILTGIYQSERAQRQIDEQWKDFIIEGWGCKCTIDQPWVTVAETCELIMALVKIGDKQRAKLLLDWVFSQRDLDGGFWTGIKLPEKIIYPPDEKNTWTAAAVILATLASIGGETLPGII